MTLDITEVVRQADGEVVGKIRLQKMVYLLDRLGFKSGFPFEYHHFGPYSKELDEKVEESVEAKVLESEAKRRQSDGVPYVIYRAQGAKDHGNQYARMRELLQEMNRCSPTVLELAATIDWLAEIERCPDWPSELKVRKGAKTAGGRTEKALELLNKLGLSPAA